MGSNNENDVSINEYLLDEQFKLDARVTVLEAIVFPSVKVSKKKAKKVVKKAKKSKKGKRG
jgi:hypothetical protein